MTIVSPSKEDVAAAANTLRGGGVVAFPTETVYGLGCDTFNVTAIQHVYDLKGRPKNNPTIAHVLEPSWALKLTPKWDDQCEALTETFWPGPLTLVLPKSDSVPKEACGGRDTIAIRCPKHEIANELLAAFGGPISAPSANKSGYISPTTAEHVEWEFGGDVLVLNGGQCSGGIESTVLSLIGEPAILRPGTVSQKEIEAVIGCAKLLAPKNQTESPGTAAKHYSPNTTTVLCCREDVDAVNDPTTAVLQLDGNATKSKLTIQMPSNPHEYATNLYSALREADAAGACKIMIELPPDTAEWFAIHDRLKRCTAS